MAAPKKKSDSPLTPYNPFFIALNGITLLFSNALSVGIVILVISALTGMISYRGDESQFKDKNDFVHYMSSLSSTEILLIIGVLIIIVTFSIVVGAMMHGIQSYTAMRLAKSEKTTIGEAFNTVLGQFGGYLLLYVWMNIKIFLWTLLLIVPGIIAYYRYTFAGVIFFDKNLHREAAIKESNRLTKGGIVTLLSSNLLFNLLTLGYISRVISIATTSELYREYTALDAAKRPKPAIHWLSWVSLALPFVILAVVLFFIISIAVVIGVTGGLLLR